jgi:hypothetical protein
MHGIYNFKVFNSVFVTPSHCTFRVRDIYKLCLIAYRLVGFAGHFRARLLLLVLQCDYHSLHTHTHTHARKHTCTHTHTQSPARTQAHTLAHSRTHADTDTRTLTLTHARLCNSCFCSVDSKCWCWRSPDFGAVGRRVIIYFESHFL